MSDIETPVVEAETPSKLTRIKRTAIRGAVTTGIFVVPSAVMVGASVLGYKTSVNNLEAAKLAFETAKLTAQQA